MTLPAGEWGQQKISSPSVGTSDAGPSGNGKTKKGKESQKKTDPLLPFSNTSLPRCKQMTQAGGPSHQPPARGSLTGSVNEVRQCLSLPTAPFNSEEALDFLFINSPANKLLFDLTWGECTIILWGWG